MPFDTVPFSCLVVLNIESSFHSPYIGNILEYDYVVLGFRLGLIPIYLDDFDCVRMDLY